MSFGNQKDDVKRRLRVAGWRPKPSRGRLPPALDPKLSRLTPEPAAGFVRILRSGTASSWLNGLEIVLDSTSESCAGDWLGAIIRGDITKYQHLQAERPTTPTFIYKSATESRVGTKYGSLKEEGPEKAAIPGLFLVE